MSTQWNTTHKERNELLIYNNLDGSQKYYAEFPNKPVSKGYILQKTKPSLLPGLGVGKVHLQIEHKGIFGW